MKTAASLPASVDYLWYGKKVTVDLAACREAMCIKALSLELSELGPTKAFARSVKLHPDTVYRFFSGKHPVGPTATNMLIKGLGLRPEQVLRFA
jgi:hypothetical protein